MIFSNNDGMYTSRTMTGLLRNLHLYPHKIQCQCWILFGKRGTWLRSQTKQARRDRTNALMAQGTAYRRNRRHLLNTQEEWKEKSSNDGINDYLEDDRAAAHPSEISQPESPAATQQTCLRWANVGKRWHWNGNVAVGVTTLAQRCSDDGWRRHRTTLSQRRTHFRQRDHVTLRQTRWCNLVCLRIILIQLYFQIALLIT